WARISGTMGILLEKRNIYIDDSSGLTPTEVRSRARLRSSTYFINTTTTYCTGLLRIPKRDVWRGFQPCFGIRSGSFTIPKKARSPFFGIVNGVFLWITFAGRGVLVGETFGHHLQP
ncbi:hypothetical protein JTL49_34395, partial [Pseudomonas aeruginosa]|nr:hypothetical protein [Pseudomonas aeruginosa]